MALFKDPYPTMAYFHKIIGKIYYCIFDLKCTLFRLLTHSAGPSS